MSLGTRVSGAWKDVAAVSVRVNGAWKTCSQVYVKVDGAWKPCLPYSTTATGPTFGNTITLSHVQNGSVITITGTTTTNLSYSNPGGQPQNVGTASYTITGASFTSSTNNGNISGTYNEWVHEGDGDAVYSYPYSYGQANSLTLGPAATSYTIKLKATSTTVTIKLTRTNSNLKTCTSSIAYTCAP